MAATTLQDVRDRIEIEGFEYAFRSCSDFPEVEDDEFHRLRTEFVRAADALEEYVNARSVGEMDDEDEEEEEDEDESDD
jgi:hypothetical protein